MFGLKYLLSKLPGYDFLSKVFKKCKFEASPFYLSGSIKSVPRMFQGTTKNNLEKLLALKY